MRSVFVKLRHVVVSVELCKRKALSIVYAMHQEATRLDAVSLLMCGGLSIATGDTMWVAPVCVPAGRMAFKKTLCFVPGL